MTAMPNVVIGSSLILLSPAGRRLDILEGKQGWGSQQEAREGRLGGLGELECGLGGAKHGRDPSAVQERCSLPNIFG